MVQTPNCEFCKNKLAVVIENKQYYCGNCYCEKINIKAGKKIININYDNRTSIQSNRDGLEKT